MISRFLAAIVVAFITLLSPVSASAAECTMYEQSHPMWPLTGAHLSTGKCSTCASCHKAGIFVGTPRQCTICHTGTTPYMAMGFSTGHIPTTIVECSSCHTTTTFVSPHMSHTSVASMRCDACHNATYNGQGARKKPSEHIPTTADCLACHNTNNWDVSHSAIHAGVTTGCVTCHDGNYAKGKSSYASHPTTSDACETCHSIDNSFKCASAVDKLINYAQIYIRKAGVTLMTVFA
jgi:hypothetical protein